MWVCLLVLEVGDYQVSPVMRMFLKFRLFLAFGRLNLAESNTGIEFFRSDEFCTLAIPQ
jgi:hypothetical protein